MAAGRGQQPNILLINCDDLGYGDLGCYGSRCNVTPFLDGLAAGGAKLTSFYAASPVCSPSRGALMTGCYPPRIGFSSFEGQCVLFPGQGVGLNRQEETIAGLLQARGYATACIGKWHCGDQPEFLPTNHGFDHYYGLPYSNDMGRQAGYELPDGGMRFPPLPLLLDDQVIEQQPDQASLTSRYVEEAVRFLRRERGRPLFLYFSHMHVHLPLYAADRFVRESQNGDYGACVAEIDWAAAALVQELKQLGLYENTLILFTSDNGSRGDHGGSNAPLRGAKQSTWEGGMRVPMIAHWPGHVPAGQVLDGIACNIDLLPTLVGLAGAGLPEKAIDGVDLWGWLSGQCGRSPRDKLYYYRAEALEAVRSGPWKLHFGKWGEPCHELYHLDEDPAEQHNLYDSRPDVVKRLEAVADDARTGLGDSLCGMAGSRCRPVGRVENPAPLTGYDPNHPYIIHMYDKGDAG